jgi:type IV pilus assembly protein PilM
MFFTKKSDIVGIDIGSSSIKLVQLNASKGGYSLQHVGLWPLPPEAIVDNTLMDSTAVVERIKSALSGLNVGAKDVATSISGNAVIIRKIQLPAMPAEELEDQIQWEAEQYIPFDINDVNIDFQILNNDEHDPTRMNVLLVASKKDVINDYMSVFNEAGMKLVVVDVDSFSLQNAFEINYTSEPDEVVALVNIGASSMNLNVVKEGASLFTRDVQVGGNLYSEEIQKQLGVSSEEAERLKLASDIGATPHLQDVFLKVNEMLSLEIRRSLDFYNASALEGKISKVYLSGGGAKGYMLVNDIGQKLALPVELLNPFANIKWDPKMFDPEFLQEIGPLMCIATGLATRRLGDK